MFTLVVKQSAIGLPARIPDELPADAAQEAVGLRWLDCYAHRRPGLSVQLPTATLAQSLRANQRIGTTELLAFLPSSATNNKQNFKEFF